jgi:hypothetical protein
VDKKDSTVIDESNNFFGEGNNGRDCIHKSTNYNFDLTNCLHTEDGLRYDANNYFLGLQKTTGVARFIDKYHFVFSTTNIAGQDKYTFTLSPKDEADFRFYIESDGTVCPKLVNRESSTDKCTFTFIYYGSSAVSVVNTLPPVKTQSVIFDNNNMANVTTSGGLHRLIIGTAQECLLINCKFTLTFSVVELEPPQYDLIQASDLALQTQIFLTFDESVNGTLQQLASASKISKEIADNITLLQKRLDEIDFNSTELYPYENFTEVRAEVDRLIDAISPIQPDYSFDFSDCETGIFGSVGCFFSNLFSTIITILIIVAIFVGLYIVCFKLGVAKILTKKVFGK